MPTANCFKLVEKNFQEGSFLPGTVARAGFCYLSLQRISIEYIAGGATMQAPATTLLVERSSLCGDLLRITKPIGPSKGFLGAKKIKNSQIARSLVSGENPTVKMISYVALRLACRVAATRSGAAAALPGQII
jgi:hypothetical protein